MPVSLNNAIRLRNFRSRLDRLRPARGVGINQYEYRVFSQHREDGIIANIIDIAGIESRTCVEFGFGPIQNNCLNLVINHAFRGLFMDARSDNAAQLDSYFRDNQNPSSAISIFLDVQNINPAIRENGFNGRTGVLSIDVDGNDYWLWDAIDVISPDLVVVEYNASFGKFRAITVPYDPLFARYEKHDSGLYHGASLKALEFLGMKKGYALLGCDLSGVNAFFIRNEWVSNELPARAAEDVFRVHRSRVKYKNLAPDQQWEAVCDLPYVEVSG
jgi:hypothetical protein